MKKTYNSPATTVFAVQIQHHLLQSSAKGADKKDGNASSEIEVLTRRNEQFNIWDDDEE